MTNLIFFFLHLEVQQISDTLISGWLEGAAAVQTNSQKHRNVTKTAALLMVNWRLPPSECLAFL